MSAAGGKSSPSSSTRDSSADPSCHNDPLEALIAEEAVHTLQAKAATEKLRLEQLCALWEQRLLAYKVMKEKKEEKMTEEDVRTEEEDEITEEDDEMTEEEEMTEEDVMTEEDEMTEEEDEMTEEEEERRGAIRVAVGQARLLLTKRLPQFEVTLAQAFPRDQEGAGQRGQEWKGAGQSGQEGRGAGQLETQVVSPWQSLEPLPSWFPER